MVEELYKSPSNLDEPVVPQTPLTPLNDEDNKIGRIKTMGVIQIVIGALCGLSAVLAALSFGAQFVLKDLVPEAQRTPVGSMIYSLLIWVAFSASLIWVGVGGMKQRRWVRSVVLAINWPILYVGVLSVVGVFWIMPAIMRNAAEVAASTSGMPLGDAGSFTAVATIVTAIGAFLFGVIFPGLHVLLYRPASVQQTLDAYDSKPRWTDDMPVSVAGLAIWLPVVGFTVLGMAMGGMILFVGLVFTGVAAAVIGLIFAAGCGALARWAVRRRPVAWWGGLAVSVYMLGAAVTPAMIPLEETYRKTGLYSETQIAMMGSMDAISTAITALGSLAWIGAVIFLVFVRKHFAGR